MTSLVNHLQLKACMSGTSTSDLLRISLVIAKKLKLDNFPEWVKNELDGYSVVKTLPEYRIGRGKLYYKGNFGTLPVSIEQPELEDVKKIYIFQAISELEAFKTVAINNQSAMMNNFLDANSCREIAKWTGYSGQYFLQFSITEYYRVLEKVKDDILRWSLALEDAGIIDTDNIFEKGDLMKAKNNPDININYYGNSNNTQVQTNSSNSTQFMQNEVIDLTSLNILIEQIESNLANISLSSDKVVGINKILISIKEAIKIPEKQSYIKPALYSMKTIFEGAAGNIIASGIVYEITKYLQ